MGHSDGPRCFQAASGERFGVDRWRSAIGAVGPHDGVQVHDTTMLELGHPAEREPCRTTCLGLRATEGDGELARGVDHRAPPQLGGTGVLEDGALVVVAIHAEGSPDQLAPSFVAIRAGQWLAVGTAARGMARVTRGHSGDCVDGTEARGGQGQEYGRVLGNCLIDSLAPNESGSDEVAGIAPVDRRAGGTANFGARATGLEDDAVRERGARERHGRLPGRTRDDEAFEPDRMAAPTTALALGQEGVDLASVRVAHDRLEHGVVVGIHGPPRWRAGVTTPQFRRGIQRYPTSASKIQGDTEISRKKFSAMRAFGAFGRGRPSATGPTDRMSFELRSQTRGLVAESVGEL